MTDNVKERGEQWEKDQAHNRKIVDNTFPIMSNPLTSVFKTVAQINREAATIYADGCRKCGRTDPRIIPDGYDTGYCETCERIAAERARCAGIVRSYDDWPWELDNQAKTDVLEEIAKEIEADGE